MTMCNSLHRSDVQSHLAFGSEVGSTHARAPEARRQDSPARSEAKCWVRHKLFYEPWRGGTVSWHALVLLAIGLATVGLSQPAFAQDNHSSDFRSMERKVAYLKQNAARPHPDPKPTELTESEANAYFNEGGAKLPRGVSNLHLTAKPGQIDGRAQVDFEQIMQGRSASNPLYGLFSGQHQVHAVSDASGSNGIGTIHIQSVDLDGIQIPPFALEWFVQHYLTPKYKNVGMTSTFKLPLRIDSAAVESGKVLLVQR